jgi:hypothetical protein
MQSPFVLRTGSPVSASTRTIDIGYTVGMILETKPIAPTLLSVFTKRKELNTMSADILSLGMF